VPNDPANRPNLFEAYIAEYNTLRAELLARIQTQNQTFNFLLVILAAGVTAMIGTANGNRPVNVLPVATSILLLLPLITNPLAYMFFDNELMIHAIGSYIYWDWRPRLIQLTGDRSLFKSLVDFTHLHPSTPEVFQPISRGRWYLFCIPTMLPIAFLPAHVYFHRTLLMHYAPFIKVSAASIFLLDVIEVIILARAIIWVFDNNRYQHRLTAAATSAARTS
jgi:hypothetical protein